MKRRIDMHVKIFVVDVGGSHIKCFATNHKDSSRFKSGSRLTPERMRRNVLKVTNCR